jgi:hypothetical protein
MRYGWSHQPAHWEAVLEIVRDPGWKKTKLETLFRDGVPRAPGVYAICASPAKHCDQYALATALYNVLYLGRASSLRQRFTQHCRHPNMRLAALIPVFGPSPLEYWYLPMTECSSPEISRTEAALIECLGPVANSVSGSISAVAKDPIPAGQPRESRT